MKVTVAGIIVAVLGVVILALAPAAKRALVRKQNPRAGSLSVQNWVIGVFVLVFGVLIAAHLFNR